MKLNYFSAVLIFCSFLFVIDRIGAELMKHLLAKSEFRYVRLYEGRDNAEIVIVGNSRGVNTFFTPFLERELKKSITNISYNDLKAEIVDVLISDYVEFYHPKLVIFEIDYLFKGPKNIPLLRDLKLYTDYSDKLAQMLKRDTRNHYYAGQIFSLFKYNTPFFYRNIFYFGKSDKGWINNYKISSELIKKTQKMESFELKINNESLNIFNESVKKLKEEGILVKMVFGPYLPLYKEKIIGFEKLTATLKAQTGLDFFDYSGALAEPKHFGDRIHSNKAGALILGEKMIADGVFEF